MQIIHMKIELFREAVKRRRLELGMSQQELAEKVGYKSGSTISKFEHGLYDVPHSKIDDFAEALKTTPSNLISRLERCGGLIECEFIK